MPVDNNMSIDQIKVLTDNYNVILEKYLAANKSLTSLGVYEVLSNKKISGGTSTYSGVVANVEACQSKCAELNCSVAAYNSVTMGCNVKNTGSVIDGPSSKSVIVNKQIYYLQQLVDLNAQLSAINTQIIAKIVSINNSTLTSLHDERVENNATLAAEKASLTQLLSNSSNNMIDSNVLDLEYIQRDEELETNSYYYIFLLLTLICLIALVVLISTQ